MTASVPSAPVQRRPREPRCNENGDAMKRAVRFIITEVYLRFTADDGLPLAGNIAFCLILAIFPFLILLSALAGFIGDEKLAETVVDYLLSVAPSQLVAPLADDIHTILTVPRGGLLTLSILATLYTAAGGVESVRVGLNRAYGYSETRWFFFRYVQSFAFVIVGAVVLLALALLIVFGPLYWSRAEQLLPWLAEFTDLYERMRYPVALALMLVTLLASHLYLPVKRHRLREILPGVVFTMAIWLLSAWTYAAYLAEFSRLQVVYAGVANVMIALIFLYISAVVMILGGELNQAIISFKAGKRKNSSNPKTGK